MGHGETEEKDQSIITQLIFFPKTVRQNLLCLAVFAYKKMRLFTAIQFDKAMIDELITAQKIIKENYPGCRLSKKENLHLTIEFFGECDRKMMYSICMALDEIKMDPFKAELDGLGSFRSGESSLIWAGIKSDELKVLKNSLDDALIGRSIGFDKKPFKPHITLARECGINTYFLKSISLKGCCIIDKVSLMQSNRVGGELKYSEVYSKKFGRR